MKIFVTILVASTLVLASGDISLKQNYNYNPNALPQAYYEQPPQQQQPANLLPASFFKPSQQYLPIPQMQSNYQQLPQNQRFIAPQHQQQQQQQQQQHQQQQQLSQQQLSQQQISQQQLSQPIVMSFPMPSDFPANFNFQPVLNNKPSRRFRPRQRIPRKPIVTKNFFIHSAPEETQAEIDEELAQLQQQPRKHYNVLFVKTPSQANKAAALNLAKALKEEKTVVYVLAKKTSATDLQDAIKDAPQHINKPEVFFIKYRTPEEAANAQRQIQSQYDSLGGSTTITDEGVAPSTSVIGSLDATEEEEEEEVLQQQQQQQQQSGKDQLSELIQPQQIPSQQSQQQQFDEQQLVNAIQSATNGATYLPPSNRF